MLDKVNIFTRGFDNNVGPEYPHLLSSIDYLKKFNGRGYYFFVENRLNHNCEISGEFNSRQLIFHSTVNTNLIQAEIDVECIKMGDNNYKIVLTPKHDKNSPPEENEGSLFV